MVKVLVSFHIMQIHKEQSEQYIRQELEGVFSVKVSCFAKNCVIAVYIHSGKEIYRVTQKKRSSPKLE